MLFILLGFVCAFLGALPHLLNKRMPTFGAQFIITGFFAGWLFWSTTPSSVMPLFGTYGVFVLCCLIISFALDLMNEQLSRWSILPLLLLAAAYILIGISGSNMLRSSDYANFLTVEQNRAWTKDVQPKDPAHMRISTKENALYQAQKSLGSAGTIGSQFEISADNMTLQLVNGELWYVAPLDFKSFSIWTASNGIPVYVKVSAEDPTSQPIIVTLKSGQEMTYSPAAFFSHNLERHMRENGYLNKGLSDWTFEVDETGTPFWVVTVSKPTIAWSGERVLGVAVVEPVKGDIVFYKLGEVPDWIDRVIPSRIVSDYLSWNGEYSGGWLNSWWAGLNLTKPEEPTLVYGADNQPQFVTGITSSSQSDDSLVALVYTNSRTGKSVKYVIKGGATETAVLNAVNSNQEVQYKKLHGSSPQLYNVNGIPTSVVPLFNDVNAYQGVAMVDIANIQQIAVGADQYEALRAYEKILSGDGSRVATGNETEKRIVEGFVSRVGSEVIPAIGSTYYIQVENVPQLFTAGPGKYSSLVVTQKGDKVRVEVYKSDRDSVPVLNFKNLSLTLTKSAKQQQVQKASDAVKDEIATEADVATIKDRINNMTPEQLKELGKQIPPVK